MKRMILIGLTACSMLTYSCNKFLELKPDIKMAIPSTLDDADLLLNDYTTLNTGYPIWGEIGTDDYYVTPDRWAAASSVDQRNAYIWADEPYNDAVQWQRPYKAIYIANQVIDVLSGLDNDEETDKYKRLAGGAHFYRAFALHQLVGIHCSAYLDATAENELGLPLRLTPNIDELSRRASLKDTYAQIIADFRAAIDNLPILEAVKGRPFKASAYAGMARVYLDMGDFVQAYAYADSCLQLNPDLLDYNTLKVTDALPVPRFNIEVLFPALSANLGIMGNTSALMDPMLYQDYDSNDLRRGIFFRSNSNPAGSYYFKGSYDKSSATMFVGITTSEIYLVKAESACRTGEINEALTALNTLLKARWNKNESIEITETNPELLLLIILQERRKELLFRGRRWADLKRLNLDPRFQKTLERTLGEQVYKIEPNSLKYAFRLSETVVRLGGINQNKR